MPQPPNILLILCDELRADALSCAGNSPVCTPNIDRLAAEGTRFSQCMVTQPSCTPSRASILSGCWPSTLGTRMVGCHTPDDPRFLPHVLHAAGWRTASLGKLHFVPQGAEPQALDAALHDQGHYYGFREVDLVNGHGDRCFGPRYTPWLEGQCPDWRQRLQRRRRLTPGINCWSWELPEQVHSSHYLGMRAGSFLAGARQDERPFFLQVSFPDPHYPFMAPEPWASLHEPAGMPPPLPPLTEASGLPPLHEQVYFRREAGVRRADGSPADRVIGIPPHDWSQFSLADWQQVKALYYGMVALIDHNVGRILDALEASGLLDNTIVVFASDHGEHLGDHGLYGKGLPYDSALRVPLIWRGAGIARGQHRQEVASTLDIAPTLLDLTGIALPEGMQGHTMRAQLAGAEDPLRDAVLTENDDDFVPMKMRVLTTSRWKLVHYMNGGPGELYDRINDPAEMTNLWSEAEFAPLRASLMARLLDEVICSQEMRNGRRQSPAPPVPHWLAGPS
ncbi:MAG: sulfatase-like hydrolase/transferase [Anaerolineaceae bacterium]|nr:sulfatase-like hydrolase/transferase [Anaerolineaceae bacterium]